MAWGFLVFSLGVFGGLAGVFIVGLPITLLLPVVLVAVGKRSNHGTLTILSYSAGLALVPPFVIWQQTADGHRPSVGASVVSGLVVAIAVGMAFGSRLEVVRGSRR